MSFSELLEDQLRSNTCECLVCCTVLRRTSAMWSCSTCFNIFHLTCIKKWAASSAVKDPNHRVEEEEATGGEAMFWRCPTCQNTSSKCPNEYRCFCGAFPLRFHLPDTCKFAFCNDTHLQFVVAFQASSEIHQIRSTPLTVAVNFAVRRGACTANIPATSSATPALVHPAWPWFRPLVDVASRRRTPSVMLPLI